MGMAAQHGATGGPAVPHMIARTSCKSASLKKTVGSWSMALGNWLGEGSVGTAAPPLRTIADVDRALTQWEERLNRVDANLLELDQHSAMRDLERGPLTGLTARRAASALQELRELFDQRGRLREVLDRARRTRAGMIRRFPARDRLAEIDDLLRGPSIRLPAETAPLGDRALLSDAAGVSLSPDALLVRMQQAFEAARDTVLSAAEAWERLYPALSTLDDELAHFDALTAHLGVALTDELALLQARVMGLRGRLAADPLGVAVELDAEVLPRLTELRERVKRHGGSRRGLERELAGARLLLGEVRAAALDLARTETRAEELAGLTAVVGPNSGDIDGLATWLATLEATAVAGKYAAATVGLARWQETVLAERLRLDGRRQQLLQLIDQHGELLGRVRARSAQLAARPGEGRNALLLRLLAEAEQLLLVRPARLGDARDLLAVVERDLAVGSPPLLSFPSADNL